MTLRRRLIASVLGVAILGMAACVGTAHEGAPGVESVDVKLQPGEATVRYDASKVAVPALKDAIERAGYDVGP